MVGEDLRISAGFRGFVSESCSQPSPNRLSKIDVAGRDYEGQVRCKPSDVLKEMQPVPSRAIRDREQRRTTEVNTACDRRTSIFSTATTFGRNAEN